MLYFSLLQLAFLATGAFAIEGCNPSVLHSGVQVEYYDLNYVNFGSAHKNSFNFSYLEGLTPNDTVYGVLDVNFNTNSIAGSDPGQVYGRTMNILYYALRLTGYFYAEASGDYLFSIEGTDDAGSLALGAGTAMDCCGSSSDYVSSSQLQTHWKEPGDSEPQLQYNYTFTLEEGKYYPLKYLYYMSGGYSALILLVTYPDGITHSSDLPLYYAEASDSNCLVVTTTTPWTGTFTTTTTITPIDEFGTETVLVNTPIPTVTVTTAWTGTVTTTSLVIPTSGNATMIIKTPMVDTTISIDDPWSTPSSESSSLSSSSERSMVDTTITISGDPWSTPSSKSSSLSSSSERSMVDTTITISGDPWSTPSSDSLDYSTSSIVSSSDLPFSTVSSSSVSSSSATSSSIAVSASSSHSSFSAEYSSVAFSENFTQSVSTESINDPWGPVTSSFSDVISLSVSISSSIALNETSWGLSTLSTTSCGTPSSMLLFSSVTGVVCSANCSDTLKTITTITTTWTGYAVVTETCGGSEISDPATIIVKVPCNCSKIPDVDVTVIKTGMTTEDAKMSDINTTIIEYETATMTVECVECTTGKGEAYSSSTFLYSSAAPSGVSSLSNPKSIPAASYEDSATKVATPFIIALAALIFF